MRVLPEHLREKLSEPIGKLVDEKKLIKILEKHDKIVSVGDQVTYTLLKHDIKPVIAVIDYKTHRGNCSEEVVKKIKSFGDKTVKVVNPSSCISDELWNVLKNALQQIDKGKLFHLRVEIEGEEDLASLPAIYFAPRDVTVIYGLPDKGVLIVEPSKENKVKVEQVIEKM